MYKGVLGISTSTLVSRQWNVIQVHTPDNLNCTITPANNLECAQKRHLCFPNYASCILLPDKTLHQLQLHPLGQRSQGSSAAVNISANKHTSLSVPTGPLLQHSIE